MFGKRKAEKAIDRAYESLAWVNGEIATQQANLDKLQEQFELLTASIASIRSAYPRLEEKDALEKYFFELSCKINALEHELEDITVQLQLARDLKSMIEKREQLEADLKTLQFFKDNKDRMEDFPTYLESLVQEVDTLENRKRVLSNAGKKVVNPSKVVIASYALENDEDSDIVDVIPFVYKGEACYWNEDGDECIGHEYQSLGGSRFAGVGHDNESITYSKNKTYNAFFGENFTFEEVCVAIGSSLYLEDKVTYDEVNRIVRLLKDYYFDEDEDYDLAESLEALTKKFKGLEGENKARS